MHVTTAPRHGLAANRSQLALLVAVTVFIGGMVGLERSVLPLIAEREFGIESAAVVTSFVASFGLAKTVTNLYAGPLAARHTRRRVLIAGWLVGMPVPLALMLAPSWGWIVGANVLLGVNQGLTWSMTVNMKADLAGPRQRGLVLGMNETAGYLGVAVAAYASGVIAEAWGARPEPFYLGLAFAAAGLALSVLLVRDTEAHLVAERGPEGGGDAPATARRALVAMTARRDIGGLSQAGLVTNLNDALAWAVLPLFFVARGLSLGEVAVLAGIYPLAWALLQIPAGWWSDIAGRRQPIVTGMALQAIAIASVLAAGSYGWLLVVMLALGAGKALVYPTLLAAVGDAVRPSERATALGVYRFWRDGGFVVGALLAGGLADRLGYEAAIGAVAAVTAASSFAVAWATRPSAARRPLEVSP